MKLDKCAYPDCACERGIETPDIKRCTLEPKRTSTWGIMPGERRLFVDLDGVLADFDHYHQWVFGYVRERHTGWKHFDEPRAKNFFRDMPPMADWPDLWHAIEPLRPYFSTGVPSSVPTSSNQKTEWVAEHAGPDVPVICCRAKRKALYCRPGDIIIDDTAEYRQLWVAAGGKWIQHHYAANTIEQLKQLGIL